MNYRHGFHAGNFADVFKHALLARLLLYLTRKETPFRVIDTHAGEGAYDLAADEAERTGEWRGGVGRLADLSGADARRAICSRPISISSASATPRDDRRSIPARRSSRRALMRAQDRAIFCELRADAFERLR